MPDEIVEHRVRAHNTAAESENKIHDDRVAALLGFKGGLVPGVTVYGHMTAPVVERFGIEWIERGRIEVRFLQPFYEGDLVIVRAEMVEEQSLMKVAALDESGELCATAFAALNRPSSDRPRVEDYPLAPLPALEERPLACRDAFRPGEPLGALRERLDLSDEVLLANLQERPAIYSGPQAVAHPALLLGLANQILVRNFRLGPWIHASSELSNWSAACDGDEVVVRGKIAECFERKGHEFVILDLLLVGEDRVIQQVRHTAIYRPKFV